MRAFAVIVLSLSASFAFAASEVVIECDTTVHAEQPNEPFRVTVFRDGERLTGESHGKHGKQEFPVEMTEAGVRENLTPEMSDDNLNLAEQMVAFAMALEKDPHTKTVVSSGVDLKAVRSAKVYDMDLKPRGRIKMSLVDAKDAGGKPLGRFLSGILLGACK